MTVNKTNSFDIKKYPTKLGKDIVIFKVGHIADVFWQTSGWKPHARFNIKRTNKGVFLNQILGDKIPRNIFQHVLNEVQ